MPIPRQNTEATTAASTDSSDTFNVARSRRLHSCYYLFLLLVVSTAPTPTAVAAFDVGRERIIITVSSPQPLQHNKHNHHPRTRPVSSSSLLLLPKRRLEWNPSTESFPRCRHTKRCASLFPPPPLSPMDLPLEEEEEEKEEQGGQPRSGGFYDLDDTELEQENMLLDPTASRSTTLSYLSSDQFDGYEREEADILEEREARLYENAIQMERCVLVGVEDMSAKRKLQRNRRQRQRLDPYGTSSNPLQQPWNQGAYNDAYDDGYHDVDDDSMNVFTLEESLTEMKELIKTAGMEVVGEVTQKLNEINPKTYINTGKVAEAKAVLAELDASTIVFDAELTPGQQKALENAFNKNLIQNDFLVSEREIKVIDRTALILDIFAQHARTREGKLQVDLALHEYRKPRLTKMWTHLERQSGAGGVGLRGPGESQLEIDKRLVRDRIITLKQKIDEIQKQRTMRRRGRERMGLPILSLVGYTNAGKSSLLNYLTRAGVMAESMLFATLDPTTRKVKLPGLKTHPEVLLTDTVGFIQKLPTHLVAAFRATLEEVIESDVLIHVIDVSNPSWEKQERAVQTVLADIGASKKPIVRVLNKIDLLDSIAADYLRYQASLTKNTVAVSAITGESMSDMVACIEDALAELLIPIEVIIPYSKGDELNALHEQGNVEVVDYRETGTFVRALVPQAVANRLQQYSVSQPIQSRSSKNDDGVDWVALGRGRHEY